MLLPLPDRPNEMSMPMTTMDKQTGTPGEVVVDVEVEAEGGVVAEGAEDVEEPAGAPETLVEMVRASSKPLRTQVPLVQLTKHGPLYFLMCSYFIIPVLHTSTL